MRVERTNKTATEISLVIRADASDLEPIKKHVLGHFTDQVKVPGFRAGKAPLELIEKNANQAAILDEFMEHALNDLYRQAVEAENIRPIGPPKVEVKKFVPYNLLELSVDLETFGEIILPDYKKIKLPKPKVSISSQEVNNVIANLCQRLAERKEVERAARSGDEIIIDFSGKDETGKPVNGAEGKDYPLLLGGDTFIPGFESNLIGLKTGEDKQFALSFPKDYGVSALRGRLVTFDAKVKKVNELIEPKIDDAMAAKAGPFKTVAELKANIKKQLMAEKQRQADSQYQNELIKTIAAKSRLEIPQRLVDDQILQSEEEEKRNLVYQGQTWQEHLKAEGITEEQHRQRQRPTAEEQVKGGLILSEVAERESIRITPEELEIRLQILKGQYKDLAMQAELDKPENRRDITARLLTEKTIQKLVDYASK